MMEGGYRKRLYTSFNFTLACHSWTQANHSSQSIDMISLEVKQIQAVITEYDEQALNGKPWCSVNEIMTHRW